MPSRALIVAAILLVAGAGQAADGLRARVVAVAVDRVYLGVGSDGGARQGAKVKARFGGQMVEGTIDAVSRHGCSFPMADARLRVSVGDEAQLRIVEQRVAGATSNPAARVGPQGDPAAIYRANLDGPGKPPSLIVAAVDRDRRREMAPTTSKGWHGNIGLTGYAGRDLGDSGLDFYQVRLDSRLSGEDLAGGHLRYGHRIAVQGEFGTALDQRLGNSARRWVRADWLWLSYLPRAGGPWSITAGRILPSGFGLVGPLDGARVSAGGKIGGVSLSAGPVSDPTNLVPSVRSMRAAVDGHLKGSLRGVDLRGDVSAWATMTDGAIDRSALALALRVRKDGRFDLSGYGEVGYLPTDLRSDGRGALSLDRAHVFLAVHAHRSVDVQARYSLDRPVLDRFLKAVVPEAYLRDDLRHVSGLSVRLRFGRFSVEPIGDLDFSTATGLRWRAGGRIAVDRFPTLGSRLSLQSIYNGGPAFSAWLSSVRAAQQVTDTLDLWLGYSFTYVDEASLRESYAIHSAEVGGQWMFTRRWSALLSASCDIGAFERLLAGYAQVRYFF